MKRGFYVRAIAKIKGRSQLLHRVIWARHHGAIEGRLEIDHINGGRWGGLDCRKDNLRLVTRGINSLNRKKCGGRCSSIFKGVSRTKGGRWESYIGVNSRKHGLGTFASEEAAAMSYDLALISRHGLGIKLNFDDRGIDYLAAIYGRAA